MIEPAGLLCVSTERPPTITACLRLADGRHRFPNQRRPFSFSTLTTLLTRCRTQVDPRLLRRKTKQFWMESSPAGFALYVNKASRRAQGDCVWRRSKSWDTGEIEFLNAWGPTGGFRFGLPPDPSWTLPAGCRTTRAQASARKVRSWPAGGPSFKPKRRRLEHGERRNVSGREAKFVNGFVRSYPKV